jgi:hypothetical protein
LQTGFYLVALAAEEPVGGDDQPILAKHIAGVRYNVIRRPLSGGKGSIRQKKNQTLEEYYEELAGIIQNATGPDWNVEPGDHFFFMRWQVAFTPEDIERYKCQFLNPILEQLCDWWAHIEEWGEDVQGLFCGQSSGAVHWRMPYGTYSALQDGRPTELDEYLESGSTVGLRRAEKLFKELA